MPLKEIIAACSKNHMILTNILYVQNTEVLVIKGDTHTYQWALKG
jgi:hypothetical protein